METKQRSGLTSKTEVDGRLNSVLSVNGDLKPVKGDRCLDEIREAVVNTVRTTHSIQVEIGPTSCLIFQHAVSQQAVRSRSGVFAEQHGHAAFSGGVTRRCSAEAGVFAACPFARLARKGRNVDGLTFETQRIFFNGANRAVLRQADLKVIGLI